MKIVWYISMLLCLFTSCSVSKPFQAYQLTKSPEKVAELITADLLSRTNFMMYLTQGVSAVHYADVCTGYGALKLAGMMKDKTTINKLIARYDRVLAEIIPNTANHVDANVYGTLSLY